MRVRKLDLRRRRGQALVMVSFAAVALFSMLALSVDLGMTYWTQKSARTAADAAAIAAAKSVLMTFGNGTPVCGADCVCQEAAPCPANIPSPPTNNIEAGCLYAQQNGYRTGSGSQTILARSDTAGPPPTAPGANNVLYWVSYTVRDKGPGLFSGIVGGPMNLTVRATAAVTNGLMAGSLFLLNRQNDNSPIGRGVAIHAGGNPTITMPDGILIASNRAGAGQLNGTPTITAPFTNIRGGGTVDLGGSGTWTEAPQNGFDDGHRFRDPMGGKGQPAPLPAGGQPNHVPVPDGCLDCLTQPLRPGQYYATDSRTGRATGDLLTGAGNVTFSDGGTGFGNYVFYGGLKFASGANATFAPGRYVLAGTKNNNDIISYATGVSLQDYSVPGEQNNDAGEIFIFTDANYPGLAGHIPPAVQSVESQLGFGDINLHAGNNAAVSIGLHGINRTHPALPSDLKEFAPTVFWQDQQNSRIRYDANGNVDISCGDIDNPCLNDSMTNSTTPELHLQAHPNVDLYGLIYQPRGAWLTLQGNGGVNSSMIIITGAIDLQGGANVGSLNARDQLTRRMVALIE